MATYIIKIPNWHPPSLNTLLRGTRRQRIRLAQEARQLVRGYTLLARVPPAAGRRRVQLELVLEKGRRRPDVDASWKALLVACGALRDDGPLWCELGPVAYARGEPATVITVE